MSRIKFLFIAACTVTLLSFGAIFLFQFLSGKSVYYGSWGPERSRAEVEGALRKHVGIAKSEAQAAIEQRVLEFSEFIESRKTGAKPFSQSLVSYYGKWRALSPYIPFMDRDGHKKYVTEQFSAHIFTKEQLANAVKIAIEGSAKDLVSVENALAVAIREEILGRSLTPAEFPIASKEFEKAIKKLLAASERDAAKTAANLVVSEIVSGVATSVMLRLGVSAGILGAGAANAWWSFGAEW